MTRRQLLTALGLTGASLYLPSMFGTKRARSQQAEPIRRLVIFTTHQGTVPDTWRMHRSNPGYGDWEYNFDDPNPDSFSEILRPLHPHREKLLVLDGLAMGSSIAYHLSNGHNTGTLNVLTGARALDDYSAGGPSVDQIIANEVAVPGRIRSLELAASLGDDLFIGGVVNTAASQRAPVMSDPSAVFSRLFPAGSTPTGGGENEPPSERSLIRSGKSSVLDLVGQEYEAIAGRLGAEDRARLEQHRELVRDLELRADAIASLDCGAPDQPPALGAWGHYLERGRAMSDMVAAAFACDLTRVATIQIPELSTEDFGGPPGDVHQDFAHQWESNPEAARQMTNYNRVQAELFTYLVEALDRYSDNGGTVLDNTAVVWLSDLAHGNHGFENIPVVIAGGCGGAFRTGRYICYAPDQLNPATDYAEWMGPRRIGPPHNHLLVSLMQAMGLPNNEIGITSVQTSGPGGGPTVSFTGPLDRLA